MKTQRKPVKHLTDCNDQWVNGTNGHRVRDKSVCLNCSAYNQCQASRHDKIMQNALGDVNKAFENMGFFTTKKRKRTTSKSGN